LVKSFVGANDANSNLFNKRKRYPFKYLHLTLKILIKALLNKVSLISTSAFFQYILDNAELLIKMRIRKPRQLLKEK
jgi:hypothetical protein